MNITALSIIILTCNEEDNIQKCLTSVQFASEIILIDNSTDKTVEIAKKTIEKSKLKIISNQQNSDFAYLRNIGLHEAKYDWVFFLDADEVMTPQLVEEIQKLITENEFSGFYIKRQDYFLGKWLKYGETGNIKLLKFGKKNSGKWVRSVHEIWKIDGKIGCLQSSLQHFPHPTIREFISRINRWTTIDAEVFYKQGKRSSFWKIIIYPLGKFILGYFGKLGFLDGMPGLIMAMCMSFHSFLTRGKLYFIRFPLSRE